MLTVHLHRHDMSTVLLCCPVTNTRPSLSYYYYYQVFCDSLIMLWRVHFGEINVFNSGLVICGLFNLWRNPWLFFHSSVCLRRIFLFFFFFFKDDNAFYESNNYLCFTWQEQITQIKSDLLSVVNKEVQTLKETISKLTEENQELKQENEKLRNLVVNRKTST